MSDVLFSAYTPTNNPIWLADTYKSLNSQTYSNWEWVVVPNGSDIAAISDAVKRIVLDDSRVKILPHCITDNVGGLKQYACLKATGDILVELDHDDLLVPDCFETILKNRSASKEFFYSDWCGFAPDGSFEIYDPEWGWEGYPWLLNGEFKRAVKSFEPSARSLCEIFYAPNHVRAWTREAYEATGGYNPSLIVADDHDLVCRTYLAGANFVYLDKPLYLYRLHNTNTVKLFNEKIQIQQAVNKNKYIHQLVLEESKRKKLPVISLGSLATTAAEALPFEDLRSKKWKLHHEDSSIGVVIANDFLQLVPSHHVKKVMEEIYRILTPGGWLLASCPSTDGRGAFQDLRHLSYWNDNSWLYWTNRKFQKHYYPKANKKAPRFQGVRVWSEFPSDWHKNSNVPYTYADLVAIKDKHRLPGAKYI